MVRRMVEFSFYGTKFKHYKLIFFFDEGVHTFIVLVARLLFGMLFFLFWEMK